MMRPVNDQLPAYQGGGEGLGPPLPLRHNYPLQGTIKQFKTVHRPFSERPFSERPISERPISERPFSE
jgi:hypothetical protein